MKQTCAKLYLSHHLSLLLVSPAVSAARGREAKRCAGFHRSRKARKGGKRAAQNKQQGRACPFAPRRQHRALGSSSHSSCQRARGCDGGSGGAGAHLRPAGDAEPVAGRPPGRRARPRRRIVKARRAAPAGARSGSAALGAARSLYASSHPPSTRFRFGAREARPVQGCSHWHQAARCGDAEELHQGALGAAFPPGATHRQQGSTFARCRDSSRCVRAQKAVQPRLRQLLLAIEVVCVPFQYSIDPQS